MGAKMKKLALGGALAAFAALPALGIEVYNNEEKDASVVLYGSLRGFVGGGGTLPQLNSANTDSIGRFLIGFQTNSHFGIDTKYGKLFTKVEFGLSEPGFLGTSDNNPGLRKVFGTYDFEKYGKLTFGKTDTPSIEGGFQSDFNNNDAGGNGFGSVITGSRKLQVQYEHSGAKVAIIADEAKEGNSTATAYMHKYSQSSRLSPMPRIAVSYEKGDKKSGSKIKFAATYKWYGNNGTNNDKVHLHAGHILVGAKAPLAKDADGAGRLFISGIFNYGINGHLYNEQQTAYSDGNYGYTKYDGTAGINAQRAGLLIETSGKLDADGKINFAAGAGFQATFNGVGQRGKGSDGRQGIYSYKIYANFPINVAKGFQVVPHIGYYDTIETYKSASKNAEHSAALVGLLRLKYDF